MRNPASIAIVGGGFAGLAAAVELAESGHQVTLYESRRTLGGRAGSYVDPVSGAEVDHCQHVAMGCCTELLELFQRTGLADAFRRDDTLYFFGPDGRRHDLRAAPLLPAPLHLAPSLLGLSYLGWRDRWRIARALPRLARIKSHHLEGATTFGEWLRAAGQSETAIRRFWSVVVVSALSDTVDAVSVAAARKVFVDAFLSSRHAYHVLVPRVPLATLARRIADWLEERGVHIVTSRPIARITVADGRVLGIESSAGTVARHDGVIVAVPWHAVGRLFDEQTSPALPWLEHLDQFTPAAIHSLHLWFDREWFELPHAVLIDRLSQWVFRHDSPGDTRSSHAADESSRRGTYCQVVISAAHAVERHDSEKQGCQKPDSETHDSGKQDSESILRWVLEDLADVWPSSREAKLLRWRLVRQPLAVFSPRPGVERLRPTQRTAIPNLAIAGDWTDTGWPATMEGAVRSGRRAATALLDYLMTVSNNL